MIMLKFKSVIVILLAAVLSAYGFPNYITRCSRTDAKLDECILRSAKVAVPQIMKGDAALKLPDLYAYPLEDQVINVNKNFIYTLKNIKATSGELEPTYAKMDFDSLVMEIGMQMPLLVWAADFDAKENDFHEHGHVNITYKTLQFNYRKQLEEKEIDGKTYLQIKSEKTTGSIRQIELNHVYDESSTAIGQEKFENLIPELKEVIEARLKALCGSLVTGIMNLILQTATKDDIFLK